MAEKRREIIGFASTITNVVKPEYLSKRKKRPDFLLIEIFRNKKYGAIAKLYERNSLFDRYTETTTKKQRMITSKAFQKAINKKGPVDTSKWVKPDNQSIQNELIKCLFMLEILKEDHWEWRRYEGKARILYSVLNSHSPNNPQTLVNYSIDPHFQTIMQELNSPEIKRFWKSFRKKTQLNKSAKQQRKKYQKWRKETLNKMIIKDKKPPKYVSLLTRINKSKKEEQER